MHKNFIKQLEVYLVNLKFFYQNNYILSVSFHLYKWRLRFLAGAQMAETTIATATEAENNGPRVEVKTLSDRLLTFLIDENLKTVGDVKDLIAKKEALSLDSIVLVQEGKILEAGKAIAELHSSIQPSTQIQTTTIHWFHMEPIAMSLNPIETAKDWDAKNRLRCFVGIYQLSRRRIAEAAELLTECLPTFQDVTFISFQELVKYAIIAAILTFDRPDLNKKVLFTKFDIYQHF